MERAELENAEVAGDDDEEEQDEGQVYNHSGSENGEDGDGGNSEDDN